MTDYTRDFAQRAAMTFLNSIDGKPVSAEATAMAAQAWATLALSLPEVQA